MNISWFGHSCFRIETKDNNPSGPSSLSILIDPFSKDIGLKPPKQKDDIVLISHHHYDHANLDDLSEETFVIDGPGEYEKRGIAVRGINSYHDSSSGSERGLNTIYIIQAEDMRVCHLGDLGQKELLNNQIEEIGDVDVLMIPVGGKYTMDSKEAIRVISQIEPKIVIPMHYKLKDLNLDIDGPEKFIKEIGITAEKTDKLKLNKKTLPIDEMKLIIFEP